jgi:S-DNA-T family DNA segregation ATPase FtsK/SpoIIIE
VRIEQGCNSRTSVGLERAAHVSAIITNLADEAHLVIRMRDALAGEVHRRQQLLREAGVAGIGDYRRSGASVPLPALVLIVDEFAELLTAHPDFAELFLAIGRVGRSLGMHLLLASQRLDEGRLRGLDTHLSYRICLKTFSASESRAVLGVPDAYQLPATPGAAYLKTASGEMTRFHAAYVSRPYLADVPAPSGSGTVRRFTACPDPHDRREPVSPPASGVTVLDAVLDRVAGHGTPAHRVWLEPLAGPPTLDTLLSRMPTDRLPPLTVPVGLVDSPFDQRRDLMVAALADQAGNVAVVGGPRSGKSTVLCTLVLALAATHDPRDVQIYGLDFGGGTLSSTRDLPHVGAVAGRHDTDLLRRTVGELDSLLQERESRFRAAGIDSIAEHRRRRAAGQSDDLFGDVFLVIDGWAGLRASFEHLEAPITALAAQGLAYGIHVVLAASRWADLRPALKDHLGTRIELRLGDPAESEMDRRRARELSDCPPGRGITRDGRDTTLALPRLDGRSDTADAGAAMRSAAQQLRQRYAGRRAPSIAVLPASVNRPQSAARPDAATRVVLGVGERALTAATMDFAVQPHLIVLGDVECGKTATLRTLCTELVSTTTAAQAQILVVDFRRTLLGVVETDHLAGYAMSASSLAAALSTLGERLSARMPGPEVTQHQLRARSWWSGPEVYVVVDDYDLVAEGTGLTPLLAWLPHARDVGLHLVVARRSGGAARAMFDPVLTRLRDLGAMGLMMSAAPEEGVLLGSVRPSVLPPGRGTLITRGRPDELVQVAWCDPP